MELPQNNGDLENAKLRLAQFLRSLEKHFYEHIDEIANSGFADRRLCAVARTNIETGLTMLEKALRIGAPNEYAKQPLAEPYPQSFQPRTDPAGSRIAGANPSIEDYRADGDLTQPR